MDVSCPLDWTLRFGKTKGIDWDLSGGIEWEIRKFSILLAQQWCWSSSSSAPEFAKFRLRSRYARSECAHLLRDKLGRIFPDSSSLSNALPWLGNSAKVSPTIACHSILPVTEFAFEFAGSFARSLEPIPTIGTEIEGKNIGRQCTQIDKKSRG